MAKPEWGTKRLCLNCGARFYDFMRQPITCPACGTVLDLEVISRSRRPRAAPRVVAGISPVADDVELETDEADVSVEVEEEDIADDEVDLADTEVDEGGDASSLIEDTDDLGDDDDVVVIDDDMDDDAAHDH